MDKHLRKQLILAFYVPSGLIAIAYSLLTPVLPVYAGNLTSAYVLIGVILAAESIGRVVGDIPVSGLMRRIGMKQTMLVGLWLALFPMLLLFGVTQIWLIIILLFTSGLGHAFYNISRHAYIAVTIPNHVRGRAIGLLGGVFRFGKFLGPLLGGWVGGVFGLRSAFLLFVLLALATLGFVWRFMGRVDGDEREQPASQRALVKMILRSQQHIFATAGSGQILAQLTRAGWLVIIPLYAANVLNLNVQTIGLIIGAGSALDMLFFYLSGILMDRFGRKWAIVPSFILQGVGVLLIPFMTGAVSLALVAAFIGFANAISSGSMMTLGADFAPPEMRGEFLGVWRLIGDAGMVAAPVLVGSVAQVLVLQMSVVAIAGSGFGAALLFALFVPETLKRQKRKPAPTPSASGG